MQPTLRLLKRPPAKRAVCLTLLCFIAALAMISAVTGQEPLRVRRNFFGMHNLKDGGPEFHTGMDWTKELVGSGFVLDWVTDITPWIEAAFQRNLVPCVRVQECNGGCTPSPGYAGEVASIICNYKLQHPQYADRLVYLQLWNEPNDPRDYVSPDVYADYLVAAYNAVHNVENAAAAQKSAIAGTLKCMTPGQNGASWWDQAFTHNPQAKNAFDVWGTHPYPEAYPPWYCFHDGVPYINQSQTIDSYLLDLDVVAANHGGVSRVGFPVMITETAYGDHLGMSFEGYPKTTRAMAADYNVKAFRDYWYKWPEIVAVHPFILCNISWEAFAWVTWTSGSQDTDGDGVLEPTAPYQQYTDVKAMREGLDALGTLAPARLTPYRGAVGTIQGTITRSDTGAGVSYATVYTDGYEFGNTSVSDGRYAIRDVPTGTYTLTCHRNGYQDQNVAVTVTSGGTATVNFSMLYMGKDPKGIYFVDSPNGGCSGCNLYAAFLGQTFKTPADVGYVKFCSAKPNVGSLYLKFTLIDGSNPNGPVVGTFNSYYLDNGGEMIGGEASGDGIPVQPNHTYFLKIERTDGQGVYLYASSLNPYADGNAWVGNTSQPSWDLYGCIRGNKVAVVSDVGTISGNVKNSSSQNLSGATVLTSPGGHAATTDSNGNYGMINVPVGTYDVTASKSGYTSSTQTGKVVTKNQTTTVNFTLSPAATGMIAGNVKDSSNQNLQGATVSTNTGGYTTTTDANGNYTLSNVTAGTYNVTASKTGYTSSTQTNKTVTGGQTTTVNFTLSPSAPFSGLTNTNFEGGFFSDPDVDHQTANSWHRFAISGTSKSGGDYGVYRSSHWSQSIYESSWVAGIYQQCTDATLANNYTVSVYVKGSDTSTRFWIGIDPYGGTDASSANVQWSSATTPGTTWTQISKQTAAQSSTITVFIKAENTVASNRYAYIDDATIADNGSGGGGPTTGTISGSVKDTNNVALSGATVSTTNGGYTTTSAADGSYALNNVAPATYDVVASKSGYNPQTQTGKTVTAGQTTTTNFNLSPSSAIASEDFESMPSWNSTYNATWGSAATWSIAAGGQTGNFMQASRSSQGSSSRVKVYTVPTNTSITISVYMKCPSYGGGAYWIESAYRLGSYSAQDFDQNSGWWTLIKKFSNSGYPNGNGDVWTQYTATVNTGSNTQISIGYKHGASGCVGPTVGWDTFRVQ